MKRLILFTLLLAGCASPRPCICENQGETMRIKAAFDAGRVGCRK